MSNALFTILLGLVLKPLLWWASMVLPRERWQILAAIPIRKAAADGCWHGTNMTFYGVLLASGTLGGTMAFFLLLASIGIPLTVTAGLIGSVLLGSTVAASVIARLVEKRRNTLTVAGASITGLIAMPPAVLLHNWLLAPQWGLAPLPLLPVMAALAVGYLIGEGIGRLACISFGCCYGRPVAELGPWGRRIFSRFATTFEGRTKKISYASGLDKVKVVPIQAITSYASVSVGLVAMYLYLEGHFAPSFLLASLFAFGWRVVSERFRADFRGVARFTAYQRMALAAMAFCLLLALPSGETLGIKANLGAGLTALWQPAAILFFQGVWLALFCYTGLSKVTGATLAFHVRQERL
ncbi:MAG: prolipoprotein diacylglyceryl transferase family protein [Thermodesulfobacteriota bacterium]